MYEHMKGTFIVLEGPDGSGTTKHTTLLAEALQHAGNSVFLTKEPTEGPIGQQIRSILTTGGIPPMALQLMFTADRAWHIEHEVMPVLEAGNIVVSDRYALSTIVYGEALGLDAPLLESLNNKFIQPDIQILLLPPFETCLERLGKRETRDILEDDSLQRRVYDAYWKHAKKNNLTVVDTNKNVEDVAATILSLTQQSR